MNTLDLVIALTVVVAGIGGWRFGLVARLLAWCGVVAGVAIGIGSYRAFVTGFGGTSADDRVAVAALFLLASATLGQAAGMGASVLVHRSTRPLPKWDRALGAVFGGVGVVVFVWMLIPTLELAAGWPARLAHRSPVVQLIDRVTPDATFRVRGRRARRSAQAPYPSVDPGGGAAVDVGDAARPRRQLRSGRRPCSSVGRRGERRRVLERPARIRAGSWKRDIVVTNAARDRRCIADPCRGCVRAPAHRRGRCLRPAPRPRAAQGRWLGRRSAAARRGHRIRRRLRLSRGWRARAGTGSRRRAGPVPGQIRLRRHGASGTCSCSRCNWRMATPAGRS